MSVIRTGDMIAAAEELPPPEPLPMSAALVAVRAVALAAGQDVIFDIDWQGHLQLRAALPGDVVGVFVLPPSFADLHARLRRRGSDSAAEIARRMEAAQSELAHWAEFDHVLVNRDLDEATACVRSVLHAARCARSRQPGLGAFVAGLVPPSPAPPGVTSA